jgi:drug/metabolite transporter (DMT)-like permease
MGIDQTPVEKRGPDATLPLITGAYGGHTIDFRGFAAHGMILLGRLQSGRGQVLEFADDPAAVVSLLVAHSFEATATGVLVAIISGGVATGLGYIVWYLALRGLPATYAATVQLCMPALVAVGGVGFLAEPITMRILVAFHDAWRNCARAHPSQHSAMTAEGHERSSRPRRASVS